MALLYEAHYLPVNVARINLYSLSGGLVPISFLPRP
jgi:hypothetical protein